MSEYLDIESEIESRIVRGLRALMTLDEQWTVDADNNLNSKVLITSSKPREQDPSRPHIYIDNISYRCSDVSLNQGVDNDIIDEEGDLTEVKIFKVDYSLLLVSISKSRPVAKNIANRVVEWMWVKGRDFFGMNLGVKINNVRKTPGNKFRASENKELYSENISMDGFLYIKRKIKDIELSGVLETITLNCTLEI